MISLILIWGSYLAAVLNALGGNWPAATFCMVTACFWLLDRMSDKIEPSDAA